MNYNFEENIGVLERSLLPDSATIEKPLIGLLFRNSTTNEHNHILHLKRINQFTTEHSLFYEKYWESLANDDSGNALDFVRWMIRTYPNTVGAWILDKGYLDEEHS